METAVQLVCCYVFVNVYQFACVLLSLLILRVGCGIRMHLFLIISFLFAMAPLLFQFIIFWHLKLHNLIMF